VNGVNALDVMRSRAVGNPFLVDGLLAVGCAALIFPGFLGRGAPVFLAVLLTLFSAGPLTVRRSMPLAVLAATTAVFLVALLWMKEPGPGMVCCLVALYSAAVAAPRTRALITGTITAVVVQIFTLLVTGHHFLDSDNLVLVAVLGAVTAIGDATRNRRAYIQAIKDRALRAERTREVEARRRVAEERLRLARDLHDIVAHSITVINFQAGVAAHLLRRQPDAAEAAIEHVITASGSTLAELGTILTVLRQPDGEQPPPEPMPTLDRLDDLLDGFRAAGLAVGIQRGALRDHQRGRVAEAELELAADHARHDGRAALRRGHRDVEAVLLVDPLLLAEIDGGHVDDRNDPDLDLGGTTTFRRGAAGISGRSTGRGHEQKRGGGDADE